MKRITRVLMAFALMPLMALAVESSAELSTWTSDFVAAKAVADSENRPMVVVWSNYGCAYCERLYVALTNTEVMTWLSNTNYVSVYSIGDKEVKDFARNDSGLYPYVAVYWNKSDGVTNKVTFTGRSGKMPKLKGTLAGQFMASVDKVVGTMQGDYADPDERRVTFDPNGGACEIDHVVTETGKRAGPAFPKPTRKGYRFLGWFTSAVGGEQVYADEIITDDVTYFAHWEFITDYIWEYDEHDEYAVVWDCLLPLSANGKLVFPSEFGECEKYILGESVFSGRDDITSVEFSSGVRNSEDTPIGFAFWGCTNLLSFAVAEGNADFISKDGTLFSKDGKHLVLVPRGVTEFVIPDGVEAIDAAAFAGCMKLETVSIPASVQVLGGQCFDECENLTAFTFEGDAPIGDDYFEFPESVSRVYAYADSKGWVEFEEQYGIEVVVLPARTATVSYQANGGSSSQKSISITKGCSVGALPVATRTGYTFLGWFTAAVGGEQVTEETTVTADVTWYAQWKAVEYDITYLYLKGAENPNPKTYTVEDEFEFEALDDVLGWTFLGWTPSEILQGSTGDKTIAATWTEKYRTVSFYKTYKSVFGEPIDARQVQEGARLGEFPDVSLDGHTLQGWYVYDDEKFRREDSADASTIVTSDMTIFAKWTPNEYTVTFNADGGAVSPSSQVNTYGEEIGKVPSATKTGYSFRGWYADGKTYPGEVLADYKDTFWDETTGIEYESYSYGLTSNITVRAKYEPIPYAITYAGVKHGNTTNPTAYTIEDAVTFVTLEDVAGYRFAGWSPSAIAKGSTGDKVVTAHYEPISYAISYVNTKGAANANPMTYTIEDAVTFAPLADVEGWKFIGWSPTGIGKGNVGVVTVSANWEKTAPDIGGGGGDEEPMDTSIANTYDGVIVDADGLPMGYVCVKAAKATGKAGAKVSKVTATIQMVGEAKKVTVKASVPVAEATVTQTAADGRVLDLTFSRYGIWGTFDGYEIDGVRNLLTSTAKSDRGSEAKELAESVVNELKGNYVMAYGDEYGWNGLSVSVMAKGKVKVSGKLANGTSVSTSTQLIVGDGYSVIPVFYTKGTTSFAFNIYYSHEDGEMSVFGYYDAVISPVTGLDSGLSFYIDESVYDLFEDYTLLDEHLPDGLSVEPRGSKLIVDDGAKAGKIVWDKSAGEVNESKSKIDGYNVSGLKLTFTAKTGAFKGSFKVYAIDGRNSLKTFTATVSGVVVDGIGYGVATIRKIGSVAVVIAE